MKLCSTLTHEDLPQVLKTRYSELQRSIVWLVQVFPNEHKLRSSHYNTCTTTSFIVFAVSRACLVKSMFEALVESALPSCYQPADPAAWYSTPENVGHGAPEYKTGSRPRPMSPNLPAVVQPAETVSAASHQLVKVAKQLTASV